MYFVFDTQQKHLYIWERFINKYVCWSWLASNCTQLVRCIIVWYTKWQSLDKQGCYFISGITILPICRKNDAMVSSLKVPLAKKQKEGSLINTTWKQYNEHSSFTCMKYALKLMMTLHYIYEPHIIHNAILRNPQFFPDDIFLIYVSNLPKCHAICVPWEHLLLTGVVTFHIWQFVVKCMHVHVNNLFVYIS